MNDKPRGRHSRGYLPHRDFDDTLQFITIRLFDSLPQNLIERWRLELEHEERIKAETALRKRVEKYLDQGHGACYLRAPEIAGIVKEDLYYGDGKRYELISWVVMPNHVHFMIRILPGNSLSVIMKSIKGVTARKANKSLNRTGSFWQEDYFDRRIRDEKHYFSTINYIEMNPVKARLCKNPKDWLFGSASDSKR